MTSPDAGGSAGRLTPSAAYLVVRGRLSADLAGIDTDQAQLPVPCCPDWTVRETLAHLVGVGADILTGQTGQAGSPAWTARQVADRAGVPVTDLLAEWSTTAPAVAGLLAAAPKIMGQVTMDGVTHEYDLRGALGLPLPAGQAGGDPVLAVALDWLLFRFGRATDKAGYPPFRLITAGRCWAIGDGDPLATARWSPLDTLRALTGRRSLDQVRALDWDGDPEPWLPALTWAVFEPAATSREPAAP